MRVAFLGMGIMGRPMAASLVRAGHEVSTWNRSAGKDVEGARTASSPADAARGAEAVWIVGRQLEGCALLIDVLQRAPHDLRRTCAPLCHAAGGELEQIQFLLGHISIQTTERYLAAKQRIHGAVNDKIGIEPPDSASCSLSALPTKHQRRTGNKVVRYRLREEDPEYSEVDLAATRGACENRRERKDHAA